VSIAEDNSWDDRGAVLCEELERLPDRYRAAIVLCDLEGLTQEMAAHRLGWPAGTLRSRLARGRQRLRDRLTRRGLAPSVAPALAWLTGDAPVAAVPATLAEITTDAAVRLVAKRATTGALASVGSLTEGVLRAMFFSKIKVITAGALAFGLVAGTALLASRSADHEQGLSPAPQSESPPKGRAKADPNASASSGAQSLRRTAKARLDVARKLRDSMYELFRIDPNANLREFLSWQNRYGEVVGEVLVKTDADRVRFLEHRLAVLKRTEEFVRDLFKNRIAGSPDVLVAELYRLEAEDRLEKARAAIAATGAPAAGALSNELEEFLKQDTWAPSYATSGRAAPPR
jgi:hypothetical protein